MTCARTPLRYLLFLGILLATTHPLPAPVTVLPPEEAPKVTPAYDGLSRYAGIWRGRMNHLRANSGTAVSLDLVVRISPDSKTAQVTTTMVFPTAMATPRVPAPAIPATMSVRLSGDSLRLTKSLKADQGKSGTQSITLQLSPGDQSVRAFMRTEFGADSWTELSGVLSK
jgi:hypothetical protein